MGKFFYYLTTFVEAGLGAIGIRGVYEQPRYTVVERLAGDVEIRDYSTRMAVETDDDGSGEMAFRRLFRYITDANTDSQTISMTTPVASRSRLIAMTVPVQAGGTADGVMRFFLPQQVAAQGAPAPTDQRVRIVTVPPERLAVLRFSGVPNAAAVAARKRALLESVATAGRRVAGEPTLLTYDAPFTLPFVRRNEVAVAIAK